MDADVARPPLTSTSGLRGVPTADASAVGCHLFVGARHASVYQPRSPRSTRRRGRFPLVDQKLRKHGSGRRPRPQQAHGAAETREGVPQLETRSGVSRGGAFASPARVLQRPVGVPSESGSRANRIVKRSFYLRVSRDGARGRRRTQGPARGPEHAMRRPAAHSRREECVAASRRASGGPSTRRARPRPPFRRDRRNAHPPFNSRLVPRASDNISFQSFHLANFIFLILSHFFLHKAIE